jgi:hypothetical protein
MSRFVVLALLLLACSRLMHAESDGALAVTMEMHDANGRTAVVLYFIRGEWHRPSQCVVCDAGLAYRIGLTILQPHRNPSGFEMRFHAPSAPGWARWAARVRELWRSATIEPCAGIRFLLPRL